MQYVPIELLFGGVGGCFYIIKKKEVGLRWQDQNHEFSEVSLQLPITHDELVASTKEIDAVTQRKAWEGLQQGTEEWLKLRSDQLHAFIIRSVDCMQLIACSNYCIELRGSA